MAVPRTPLTDPCTAIRVPVSVILERLEYG